MQAPWERSDLRLGLGALTRLRPKSYTGVMPPLPVIASVTRCAFEWTTPGTPGHAVNVMHFETDLADPPALFAALEAHWTRAMIKTVSASAKVTRFAGIVLDGTSGTVEQNASNSLIWQGDGGSDWVPALAGMIKLRTGLRGRDHRGRVYLPYTGETQQNNGTIPDATVASVTAAWETFRTDMDTAGFPLVVASYKNAAFVPVTSIECEATCGTQRRRQTRVRAA